MYSNTITHTSLHTYTYTNHTPSILILPDVLTLISNTLTHALAHTNHIDSHLNTHTLIHTDEYTLSLSHTQTHILKYSYSFTLSHTHPHRHTLISHPHHNICVILALLTHPHPHITLTHTSLSPETWAVVAQACPEVCVELIPLARTLDPSWIPLPGV